MFSPEADPQVLRKGSRGSENAGPSVTISGLAQPQVLSTTTPTFQSNNISPPPTDGNAVNQPDMSRTATGSDSDGGHTAFGVHRDRCWGRSRG